MLSIKIALVSALGALASLKSVAAHGTVRAMMVGKTHYAGYNPSNPPMYGLSPEIKGNNSDQGFIQYNWEIEGTNAPDGTLADFHAAVSAGDKITWFWTTWPDSHRGFLDHYMARCPDSGCNSFEGNSAENWFKVGEYGYDSSNMWGTQYLTAANEFAWEFTMPSDLPSGYYLVRHTIGALFSMPTPQMYPTAYWIYLTSDGTATPSPTGKFPDIYSVLPNDALNGTFYNGFDPVAFKIPGLALYNPDAAGNNGPAPNGTVFPTDTPVTTDAGPAGKALIPVASGASSVASSASASASPASSISSSVSVSASASAVESTAAESAPTTAAEDIASADPTATPTAVTSGSGACQPKRTVTVTVTA